MEDWQGCLSPLCQTALGNARDSVIARGGYAVTVEDFLLALLDESVDLRRFLISQGVDLDELTRTVQCEQPIITEVGSENLLSSQLLYWFYVAHELSESPWMDWPVLFAALTLAAERLRAKAYVAVLELVPAWPRVGQDGQFAAAIETDELPAEPPIVLADGHWLELIEDLTVALSSNPSGMVWLKGDRGSGKTSLLRSLVATLPGGAVEVDLRREADVLASQRPAIPDKMAPNKVRPTLVLDNVSPADLIQQMASEFSVARELLGRYPGPILIISPPDPPADRTIESLQRSVGRQLDMFTMAPTGFAQKIAVVTAHQPIIERRWGIEFAPGVVDYVSGSRNRLALSPGGLLKWIERAAARLNLFAERGPIEATALAGRADALRRQSLVAMARGQATARLEYSLELLAVERTAVEVAWHERKREGSLRILKTEDLRYELERWVAAGAVSGHYIEQQSSAWEQELA